jgi:hypothetical protein
MKKTPTDPNLFRTPTASHPTKGDRLQYAANHRRKMEKQEFTLPRIPIGTWQVTFTACLIGTILLAAIHMDTGRVVITFKFRDWLEVHAEVDKQFTADDRLTTKSSATSHETAED